MQNRMWEAYMGHGKIIFFVSDCNVIKEMGKKEKEMIDDMQHTTQANVYE